VDDLLSSEMIEGICGAVESIVLITENEEAVFRSYNVSIVAPPLRYDVAVY
jgi:hypothetical protein